MFAFVSPKKSSWLLNIFFISHVSRGGDTKRVFNPLNLCLGGNQFLPKVWSGLEGSRVDNSNYWDATSTSTRWRERRENETNTNSFLARCQLGIPVPTTLIIFDSHASICLPPFFCLPLLLEQWMPWRGALRTRRLYREKFMMICVTWDRVSTFLFFFSYQFLSSCLQLFEAIV